MTDTASGQASGSDQALTPRRASLVLLGLVVLLAGYVSLCFLLHLEAIFAGSCFLFFWLGIEKAAPAAFLSTLVGAIGGIANASLFHAALATAFAINPGLAALAGITLLMLAVYLLLIHKAAVLFNQSYMLFLTVAAIPQLSDPAVFVAMVECTLLSAAYFGTIFWILRRIGARRGLNTAATLPTEARDLGDVSC